MRYLTDNQLFTESLEIGVATGAMPPTFLRRNIDDSCRLSLEPARVLPSGPMSVLLAEHTASWCLLTPLETEIARAADDRRFAEVCAGFPGIESHSLAEFFVRLDQRGLLRVDGRPGLDPRLLENGALFQDAHLVEILVTQKCNLACRYCLAEAGPDRPHLSPEKAYAAVDAAFNLPGTRPLTIQLSGGEPFVNFELFKAVTAYIERKHRDSGREVTIATQSNGTVIDDGIAAFIAEHQIAIGISCDGPQPLNDQARPTLGGLPSHERTIRGMRTLTRRGVRFGVIVVLSRANVDHPREIADFFAELGVETIKINPVNLIGDAQETWDATGITPAEYFRFLGTFMDHVIDQKMALSEANLSQYLLYLIRRVHNYRCMRSNCGAGQSFFLVDADGDVYPCAHSAGLPSWRLGAIDDAAGHLPSLGAGNAVMRQFPLRLVDRMPETQRCPWRHFCEGGCAVNAHQRFGTILAPDTLCAFYERVYPHLLQQLADRPDRFQILLDSTFGPDQATVVDVAPPNRETTG